MHTASFAEDIDPTCSRFEICLMADTVPFPPPGFDGLSVDEKIARDVQALSHGLHSSKLALLGIAAAAKLFCDECSRQQNVSISCQTSDIPSQLPSTVSLTLFRILQEALHNSAKHGGPRHCCVRLWAANGWIHLVVDDDGAGFDVAGAVRGGGIGLLTMEERIKLVGGVLAITSQPRRGTTIYAGAPLTGVEAEDVS